MEYRRRRKNTRRRRGGYQAYSAAGGRGESGGGFGLLILLLLMGGIIYVLFATSVGSWLTENVFGRKHGGNTLATTEPAGATPDLSFSNPQTQKMHFRGWTCMRCGSAVLNPMPKQVHSVPPCVHSERQAALSTTGTEAFRFCLGIHNGSGRRKRSKTPC